MRVTRRDNALLRQEFGGMVANMTSHLVGLTDAATAAPLVDDGADIVTPPLPAARLPAPVRPERVQEDRPAPAIASGSPRSPHCWVSPGRGQARLHATTRTSRNPLRSLHRDGYGRRLQ